MLPVYKPGDHVVTFNWGKIKAGNVVVFKVSRSHLAVESAKRDLDHGYIKRVQKIEGKKLHVGGDNKKESVKMLSISIDDVIGRVVWKY